ncbi:unnamed protein product [Polarella glacialis]|uniref:Pseudouridine synthase RsuA/RluA-like domain-containing protein n=2 Tax=Polarella glacialis TaxID=89957 RepID=A0A813JRV5_POLGL|nr:unnamed protein product [Polarella glacialis]
MCELASATIHVVTSGRFAVSQADFAIPISFCREPHAGFQTISGRAGNPWPAVRTGHFGAWPKHIFRSRRSNCQVSFGNNQPSSELHVLLSLGPTPTEAKVSSVLQTDLSRLRENPKLATEVLGGLHSSSFSEAEPSSKKGTRLQDGRSAERPEITMELGGVFSERASFGSCLVLVGYCRSGAAFSLATAVEEVPVTRARGRVICRAHVVGKGRAQDDRKQLLGHVVLEQLLALGQAPSKDEVSEILKLELDSYRRNPKLATVTLSGLAKARRAYLAVQILTSMREGMVEANAIHHNIAISACGKGGQWQLALNLLSLMPEARVVPDKITYSAAISACEKGCQWQLALNLLSLMPEARVVPDTINYNAAISACEKGGQWQLALNLLSMMPGARVVPDEITFNAAMSACEKGGQWQLALNLLSLMPEARVVPDKITFNAAISACEKGGQWQLALNLLSLMPAASVVPNEITYSAAISACEKGGQWELALRLLSSMSDMSSMPDKISYSAAISACEKGGQWQVALSLLSSMPGMRVIPNEISYNAAISACEKGCQWQLALSLLSAMPDVKLIPNEISYSGVISACEKGGQWQLALNLLSNMPGIRVIPSEISYSAAISACEKAGQWTQALKLLSSMPDMRIMPDEIAYSAAISACEKGSQWQLALSLFSKMSEMKVSHSAISCNAAMSACEKGGQWERALALLSSMQEVGPTPNHISYSAVISACEKAAAWEPAVALLHDMLTRQLMPNGLQAGSVASSVRLASGKEPAWKLLDGLLALWLEHERPEGKLQSSWLDDDLCDSGTSEGVVRVLGHGPGVVGIFKSAGVTTEVAVHELTQHLARQKHMPKPFDLHFVSRLDHPTSGVLPLALGAVGSAAAKWLEAQFAGRLVRKEYVCLCEGPSLGLTGCQGNVSTSLHTVELDGGRASRTEVSPLGRQAFTGYEVLARYAPPPSSNPLLPSHDGEPGANVHGDKQGPEGPELMLLRVRPLTGRTHQIRVHLASIGRPLLGDLTYGAKGASLLRSCPRLFLHARRIELRDLAGKPFVIESELPHELEDVLAQLQRVAETGPEEHIAMTILAGTDSADRDKRSIVAIPTRLSTAGPLLASGDGSPESPDELDAFINHARIGEGY